MRSVLGVVGGVLGVLAGGGCVAAGIYLLAFRSMAAFESGTYNAGFADYLAHGIGIYAISKGVALWAFTALQLRVADAR